jgi:hypothetical protein
MDGISSWVNPELKLEGGGKRKEREEEEAEEEEEEAEEEEEEEEAEAAAAVARQGKAVEGDVLVRGSRACAFDGGDYSSTSPPSAARSAGGE